MKAILVILSALILYRESCSPASGKKHALKQKSSADTIDFRMHIEPVLKKNCSPCHFPGGKMYARMPFDQDTTIINHKSGLLKRIKDEQEKKLLTTFIESREVKNE